MTRFLRTLGYTIVLSAISLSGCMSSPPPLSSHFTYSVRNVAAEITPMRSDFRSAAEVETILREELTSALSAHGMAPKPNAKPNLMMDVDVRYVRAVQDDTATGIALGRAHLVNITASYDVRLTSSFGTTLGFTTRDHRLVLPKRVMDKQAFLSMLTRPKKDPFEPLYLKMLANQIVDRIRADKAFVPDSVSPRSGQ